MLRTFQKKMRETKTARRGFVFGRMGNAAAPLYLYPSNSVAGMTWYPSDFGTAYTSNIGAPDAVRFVTSVAAQADAPGARPDRYWSIFSYNCTEASHGAAASNNNEPYFSMRFEDFWWQTIPGSLDIRADAGGDARFITIGAGASTILTLRRETDGGTGNTSQRFENRHVGNYVRFSNGNKYRIASITNSYTIVITGDASGEVNTTGFRIYAALCEHHTQFSRSGGSTQRLWGWQIGRDYDYADASNVNEHPAWYDTQSCLLMELKSSPYNNFGGFGTVSSSDYNVTAASKTTIILSDTQADAKWVNKWIRIAANDASSGRYFQIAAVPATNKVTLYASYGDVTAVATAGKNYRIGGIADLYVNNGRILLGNNTGGVSAYGNDGATVYPMIGVNLSNVLEIGSSTLSNLAIYPGNLLMSAATHVMDLSSSTNGIKFANGTGQKMGFWNATPVIQQVGANQAALTDNSGGSGSLTLDAIAAGAGYTQADMVAVKNAISGLAAAHNAVRLALVTIGMIKGAA